MVEMLPTVDGEPTRVFEREAGVVEIHEVRARETAVVRLEVPPEGLKHAIVAGLAEVGELVQQAGVGFAGPPFARYLEWGPERCLAEVGVPVIRPAPKVGRVGPGRLPGGRVASIVHVGPYEELAATYGRLQAWLEATGRGELGPMWEVYWSDPQAEPDPATWRTEILTPVE
jgi:effector-binding domain-containing protein